MYKNGFTLAEILITLTIVGIVATFTIPSISRYYRGKVLQAQLKETYSILLRAVNLYYTETNNILGSTGSDQYGKERQAALMKYIKYTKNCGYRSLQTPCTLTGSAEKFDYMNLTGTTIGSGAMFGQQNGQFITNKGALISVSAGNQISVDVNGYENPPNRFGLDAFVFTIDKEGKLACQTNDYACYYSDVTTNKLSKDRYEYYGNGVGCCNRALIDPDYWRAVRKFL